MYCPNCGAYNDDSMLFCQSCGLRLTQKQPMVGNTGGRQQGIPMYQSAQMRQRTKVSKITFVVLGEAVLFLALVFGIFAQIEKHYSAEHMAETYFVSQVNGDWEKAYEVLGYEKKSENDFINLKAYKMMQEQSDGFGDVEIYAVEDQQAVLSETGFFGTTMRREEYESQLGKDVYLNYRLKGEETEQNYRVSFGKKGKMLGIFETYSINKSDIICNGFSVSVPEGAEVTIDGVILGKDYIQQENETDDWEENRYDNYFIPEIFNGKHHIMITMSDMESVQDTFYAGEGNTQYYLEQMRVSEKTISKLLEMAGTDMKLIYESAFNDQEFSTVESLFISEEEKKNEIEEEYNNLRNYYSNNEDVKFLNLGVSDVVGKSYENGSYIDINYEYTLDYQYEDWWSGDIENDSYSDYVTSSFCFVKENGNWVLTELGCERLYYYY